MCPSAGQGKSCSRDERPRRESNMSGSPRALGPMLATAPAFHRAGCSCILASVPAWPPSCASGMPAAPPRYRVHHRPVATRLLRTFATCSTGWFPAATVSLMVLAISLSVSPPRASSATGWRLPIGRRCRHYRRYWSSGPWPQRSRMGPDSSFTPTPLRGAYQLRH